MARIVYVARPMPETLCQIMNTFYGACSPFEVVLAYHNLSTPLPGTLVLTTEEAGKEDEYHIVDVLPFPEAVSDLKSVHYRGQLPCPQVVALASSTFDPQSEPVPDQDRAKSVPPCAGPYFAAG
jgi:hypothetical protein